MGERQMHKSSRIYVAGHRGLVGSALCRRLQQDGYSNLILRGRRLGFSIKEIREVLDMYDGKDGEHVQMVHARRKFEERILVLERQKLDIDQALRQLRDGIRDIDAVLDGKPATPWTQFFDSEPAFPADAIKD